MVKNFGGKNSKKIGRKYVSNSLKGASRLRVVEDEDELYGCVLKMLGNGMCHVLCGDNIQRLCIIRNKFRGRGKRDNTLKTGTYVIVGKRSWESKCNELNSKCDLVEVYGDGEVKKLKNTVQFDWNMFKHIENMGLGSFQTESADNYEEFEFVISDKIDNTELEEEIKKETNLKSNETFLDDCDDLDVDDI